MEQNQEKIVTTRDRLLLLKESGKKYSVQSDALTMDDGWMVKTRLTVEDNIIEAHSFRKNGDPVFPALESAETVSLGRALGRAGYGIETSLVTEEELMGQPKVKKFPTHVKKEVEVDGKKIKIDTEKGLTQDKHIEAVMATVNGDSDVVEQIISDATAETPEYVIPDRVDVDGVLRRDFRTVEWKALNSYLRQYEYTREMLYGFAKDKEFMPSGVDYAIDNAADFYRYASNEQIDELVQLIKTQQSVTQNK